MLFRSPLGGARRRDVGLSPEEADAVRARAAAGACVIGMRFTEDRAVPAERFSALRDLLGDAFVGFEIDSSPGNEHGFPKSAHSVLTHEFVDVPGNPTRTAFDAVLALFAERLPARA